MKSTRSPDLLAFPFTFCEKQSPYLPLIYQRFISILVPVQMLMVALIFLGLVCYASAFKLLLPFFSFFLCFWFQSPTQVLANMHTEEARRIAMRVTNPTPTNPHANGHRVISPVAGQRASVATMVNPPAASNASSASSSGYSSMNGTNLPEVLAHQQSQQPQHFQQQQQKLHQQIINHQAMSPPPPPLPEHVPQNHPPSGRQSLLYHQHNHHRQSVSTNNLNGLESEFQKVCRFFRLPSCFNFCCLTS